MRRVLLLAVTCALLLSGCGCEPLYSDLSADGVVDFADINPFVAALTGGG